MNIRPKKVLIFGDGGVSGVGRTSNDWYNNVHVHQMDAILNRLRKYGELDDYMEWLNSMQHAHSYIYNANKDRMDRPIKDETVEKYQKAYSGDDRFYPFENPRSPQKTHKRWQLLNGDHDDYNWYGIKKSFDNGIFTYPGKRTSKDNPDWNFNPDGYFSGITDYRRLLGREGDWDENSQEFKDWQKKLNELGYETYLDSDEKTGYGDRYYKLRRIGTPDPGQQNDGSQLPEENKENPQDKDHSLVGKEKFDKEPFLTKLQEGFSKLAPDLIDALRLAGSMHNHERVYNESLKAIIPNLQQSFHTYRQVVGDEATKQGYYRRAAQGQSQAAKPFTSDADKQMAYQMEAKRIGDELRAQGDLADNQRIRETSAESAAHADANIERDTHVANNNLTELIKARAARHQLTAQKYLADWTNIDNFLLGKQARLEQKKAQQKSIQDQVDLLTMQEGIYDDPGFKAAQQQLQDAIKLHTDASEFTDWNHPDITNASTAVRKAKNRYFIGQYRTKLAKSGTKLTYKDNTDKYLYKISKDIVDHFRKMSKMTDDSRIKTLPKSIKLNSSPKTRKMQLGGVAPFHIYRPYGLSGENQFTNTSDLGGGSSSSKSSSSSKDTAAKDKLDMIKELFKSVKGLPIDVTSVYRKMSNVLNRSKALGEEMSTDDIAAMYLNSMNDLARLQYSQKAYEDARNVAAGNDALGEIAVGANGELILQDSDTAEVKIGTMADLKKSNGKLNPLTNEQALTMRAHSPNLAFNDRVFDIVNNGIGMTKIANHIKSLAGTVGSMETKIEGITQVESNKVKAGLKELAEAPDGYYKITKDIKDSSANIQAALRYIYKSLPNNYKTILNLHSGGDENTQKLIYDMLVSHTSDFVKQDITPLTGKASDKQDKDSLDKLSSNPLLARQREMGGIPQKYDLVTRDSNTRMSVNGTFYPSNPKIKDDTSIDKYLYESGTAGIMDSKYGITFGDQQISPEDLKNIMYSNNGEMIATLPCKIVNGHKQVNLEIKDLYEEAEQAALNAVGNRNSDQFIRKLGEELQKRHLDQLLDQNGLPNKNMFGQFLIVEAYATDDIKLDKNSQYIEKVQNPDEKLAKRLQNALSTDSKKSDYKVDIKDKWLLLEWGYNDIYRGNIFIPLNQNPNAAMLSWGTSTNIEQQQDLEELYQIENKSIKYNNDNKLN